jgi:hypothetical protein
MNYHSLLDWRLGLSMLRVLNDSNFVCGTDGEFRFDELQDWLPFATGLMKSFAQSFSFSNTEEINGLPIIKFGRNKRNVIMVVHPFWNLKDVSEANWLAETKVEIDDYVTQNGGRISIIDTFNLHRRPGWCYEKLINR